MAWHVGPVLSQDGATVGIDLDELDGSESGAFESKRKASNAAEQIEASHLRCPSRSSHHFHHVRRLSRMMPGFTATVRPLVVVSGESCPTAQL